MTVASSERKRRDRERKRQKRDLAWVATTAGRERCPKRIGAGVCGGLLVDYTDGNGRSLVRCPWCERRRAGVCRDCPRPVVGRVGYALRCEAHRDQAKREQQRRSEKLHREAKLASARRYYQEHPERRERRNEYKRLRRAAHAEVVRREKYRAGVREGKARQHLLAYHRKYNSRKKRKLMKRALALLEHYREHPVRPIATCKGCGGYIDWTPCAGRGRPPVWCDGCASPAEQRRRQAHGVAFHIVPEPPPISLIPPLRELERLAGRDRPRTCLTPGCTTVVTGRAKKCERCRDVARQEAQSKLREMVA